MSPAQTLNIIGDEHDDDITVDKILDAWQYLLDSGVIYSLQGSYQRMAQDLIDQGLID